MPGFLITRTFELWAHAMDISVATGRPLLRLDPERMATLSNRLMGVVGAALAYFILPFDAIPDFLPIVGLGDDASVLAAAFTSVSAYITDEHREKARAWIEDELPAGGKAAPAGRA